MHAFSPLTKLGIQDVLQQFQASQTSGLSSEAVRALQTRNGFNEIKGQSVTTFQLIRRQFTSPFIYLLVSAAAIAYVLGEGIDATMIVLFVFVNAAIGFYQEYRSEQTLKLLKQYVVRRARVRRDGSESIVASRELVVGDIVIIEPGDIVPADLRIIEATNCLVDEAVLTGESAPVRKSANALAQEASELFQATNIVFSGTTVVSGKGVGVVIATGQGTVLGDISHLATETVRVSAFAKGIGKFSSFILKLVLITLAFIITVNIVIKGPSADIPDLLIFAIALAVSVIPEALPLVTTFSLSRGALHLAKRHVVVKRLSAIEDLGSIEVLCTDKTGTLTENVLSVSDVYETGDAAAVFVASLAAPFLTEKEKEPNNAFDLALWDKLSAHERKELRGYERIDEIPFDPTRRRNTVLIAKDARRELIVRGAAEDILPLCTDLHVDRRRNIEHWLQEAGKKGQRVIAVAKRSFTTAHKTDLAHEEHGVHFVGLIAFVDPLKKTTKEAVRKAKVLGVTVKILTGDSPEVAGSVAQQIGLVESYTDVLTGGAFELLSEEKQRRAVDDHHVFARVSPQQKYRIIQLLQERHEVGFLGEGINDAPALKIANVGLVVQGASDIAQETADILLLKKSLQVVVDGIQEGRAVFVNTVKYIKATLASNFGNFYAVAIASLLIDFLPMLPLQILLVNLLSDFPMIAIATDTVDNQELKKPKSYDVKQIVALATILGIVSTVFDFIMFGLFYTISPGVLQTNWFIGSIITELAFLFSVRTRLPVWKARPVSQTLFWLSIVAFIGTISIPYTAIGQQVFKFVPPTPMHLTLILAVAATYFIVTESVKNAYYRITTQVSTQ